MCGQYFFDENALDGRLAAVLAMMEADYPGQYKTGDIRPGDCAPAIIQREGRIVAVPAVFGVPGFERGKLLINARAETAAQKKTFARGLRERRVILPATGFYEWGREPEKTKYRFTLGESAAVYLCGLYQVTEGLLRFVILTRAANASMRETHDRMPVIADADSVRAYLTDLSAAERILAGSAPALQRATA